MEINSTNGINAYANVPGPAPRADTSQLREDNTEASSTETQRQDTTTQAFEVNITQEAQDRLAEERARASEQARTEEQQQNTPANTTASRQEASQVVNIVA